jgi:acetoin utilization deacetylase AcuC-like enzyme
VPVDGHNELEDDTILSPKSGEAALRSVGGVISAVDAVMRGEVKNAFCGVRPPGHHAELQKMMGFCLFNNVAIGAFHARDVHGAKRVAVIDWDVHHGNGTQHIFWDEPDMFYGSTHQYPIFPGTGAKEETGAHGNIVNVPLAANSQPKEFRDGLAEHIMPAVRAFKPDLLLISAGFDAHANDPMANLRFTVDDYVWATRELMDLADEICEGRIVSVLEGGYDVPTLAACVAAHIRTLMGG